jgi:hypothetical protein
MSNPWKTSAQFAAFVWFKNQEKTSPERRGEANRFVRDNWVAFLPFADEGLGKLLLKVNATSPNRRTAKKATNRTQVVAR